MAISVASNYEYLSQTLQGVLVRKAKLAVTGLAANSANVIPHGLPSPPMKVVIEPTSSGGFHETQPSDAANVYVTADGTGTSCTLYVEY
ncbi:MAG TPA: hypothetical protein VFZ08_04895 [Terriglobia bacterium]|nr:hypothetical protein [Terriglobia bacterium]